MPHSVHESRTKLFCLYSTTTFATPFPPLVFKITKYFVMPVLLKWHRHCYVQNYHEATQIKTAKGTSKFTLCNAWP
jgi:hypothetical protein